MAERARAEGRPPETHGYETAHTVVPGGSLGAVATTTNANQNAVERNNAQIPVKSEVQPGEVVLVPGQSPVGQGANDAIRAAEGADRLPQADGDWTAVQNAIANDLRSGARGPDGILRANPEAGARTTTDQLKQWAMSTPEAAAHLTQASDAALKQVSGEWQAGAAQTGDLGIINDKFKAAQDANRAEEAIKADPARAAELAGATNTTNTAIDATRDAIAQNVEAARNGAPNDPLQRLQVAQDRFGAIARYGPQNENFDNIVGMARQKVFVDDPTQRVAQTYGAGGMDATRATAASLKTETAQVNENDAAAIVRNSLPTIDRMAADMGARLPAHTTTEGSRPSQTTVGARLPARPQGTLQKEAAHDPALQGTYADLATTVQRAGRSLDGAGIDPAKSGGKIPPDAARRGVVDEVADRLAAHTPEAAPAGFAALQGGVHDGSITLGLSYARALGAAPSTTTRSIDGRDVPARTAQANNAANAVAENIKAQRVATENAVDWFNNDKVAGEINRLRGDWAGNMTPEQLQAATDKYHQDKEKTDPGYNQRFGEALASVMDAGNASANMAESVALYGGEVKGLANPAQGGTSPSDAVGAEHGQLTGSNDKVAFAIAQGGQVNADANSLQAAANAVSPFSSARTLKVFTRTYKTSGDQRTALGPNAGMGLNGIGALLFYQGAHDNFSNLAPTGPNGQTDPANAGRAMFGVMQSIGFGRDVADLTAGIADTATRGKVQSLMAAGRSEAEAKAEAGAKLPGLSRVIASNGYRAFTSFYFGGFAAASAVTAAYSHPGDPLSQVLYGGQGVGWGMMTARNTQKYFDTAAGLTAKQAAEKELTKTGVAGVVEKALNGRQMLGLGLASWGGLLVFVPSAIQLGYDTKKAGDKLEQTRATEQKFLLDSGVVKNPETAKALGSRADAYIKALGSGMTLGAMPVDDEAIGPFIQQMAEHNHMTGQQLLTYLDGQNPAAVAELTRQARQIRPDENGNYPATAPNDNYVANEGSWANTYSTGWGGFPTRVRDKQEDARSLAGLDARWQRIFGTPAPTG